MAFAARPFVILPDPPRLRQFLAPVGAGIAGVEQQANLPAPRRLLDLLAAADQRARARFEPEPVERRALKLRLDPRAEVVGDGELPFVQRPRQPALELALR